MSRMITPRSFSLGSKDVEKLQKITEASGIPSRSEMLRRLIDIEYRRLAA